MSLLTLKKVFLMIHKIEKNLIMLCTTLLSLNLPSLPPESKSVEIAASTLKLRIMETTDIHTNIMNYDYYKDKVLETIGLIRTSTLIKNARKEALNTFLVDNGDLIQGTPLGTYKATIEPLQKGDIHPVYKAMNLIGYDAATFGNHEFNYGLDYLKTAIRGANFPYVNANIYINNKDNDSDNDANQFEPYRIIEKKFIDESAQEQIVKIGVLGLVTPQITTWDKGWLDGMVISKDIVETAAKFVPKLLDAGADIIIALAHSGFNGFAKAGSMAENAILPLSQVAGIDVITFSHTHNIFPASDIKKLDAIFKDTDGNLLPGVDNQRGTINGVAAVQAGYGGNSLGLIDLTLTKIDKKWKVTASQSSTRTIFDSATQKPNVEIDRAIVDAVNSDHDAVIQYVNSPIGTTLTPIHSYFSLVQDTSAMQIVANAQRAYVADYVKKNMPHYKNTPILSVSAPFKAGRNGVEEYTEIKAGPLAIKSAGDLYPFDNTLKAILIKGSVVKEWLEMSAGKFNQIDPNKTEEQQLLNPSFPVFNFDVIDGVTYQIDISNPPKYKTDGTINNARASRIINLKFEDKPIDPNQDFIIVTNNYRAAGGGNFPGVKGSKYLIDSPDENRQILMDYITIQKEINAKADNNWSIAPILSAVNITFKSSPKAAEYAKTTPNITYTGKTDENGFGVYRIALGY
jgi:2',3'-cyclic-nucleotide 2'-phosphodiesterase